MTPPRAPWRRRRLYLVQWTRPDGSAFSRLTWQRTAAARAAAFHAAAGWPVAVQVMDTTPADWTDLDLDDLAANPGGRR